MDPQVRLDPASGVHCLHIGEKPGDPNSFEALDNEVRTLRLAGRMPRCRSSRRLPPARPRPQVVAVQLWQDQMRLPAPELWIAPGWAIVGKEAFLEVRGSRSAVEGFDVFGAPLTIWARATTYDVDWGDGNRSSGLTSSGGPWPHGDVRHVYANSGNYVVRVVQRWEGAFAHAGGPSGSVPGTLQTEARFPLRVVQVQAVRNR